MTLSRNTQLKIDQICVLIKKDFKLKYDSTALGMLWSVLTPLLMSAVYWFVFGKMMKLSDRTYALYIISGNFLWHYFSAVVMQNGSVLMSNAALLKKTAVDRRLFVWGTYFTETMHFALTLPILLCLMALFRVRPDICTIIPNFLVAIVSLTYFSMGISYIFAGLNLHFRDLQRIMSILMLAWVYASPVFIPISRIPEKYLWVYDVNPMARILMTWRDAFYQPAFHPERFAATLAVSLAAFVVGRWIFMKLEPRAAEMM